MYATQRCSEGPSNLPRTKTRQWLRSLGYSVEQLRHYKGRVMQNVSNSALTLNGSDTSSSPSGGFCAGAGGFGRWLLVALLVLCGPSVAMADTLRVATGGADSGDCRDSSCQTLAYALSQAEDGDIIEMGWLETGSHTFAQNVAINKSVTLVGRGTNPDGPPVTSMVSTATPGQQAILTVTAPNVTIRNLYFSTNFNYVRQAIRAEPGANGLVIENVRIRAVGPPAIADYGSANAIWINPGEATPFAATVVNTRIEGTSPLTFFRAGIDARHAGLVATGNDIISINHDISVRRQAPGLVVQIGGGTGPTDPLRNIFRGHGVYLAAPLTGAGSTVVANNLFQPGFVPVSPATAGDLSAMRLISNPNGHPVTISDNVFDGHERGILIENFPGVTLSGNTFTPLAGSSTYQHIVLSNKELFTGTPAQPIAGALALAASGNDFAHSGATSGGTAVMLLNDNAQGEPAAPGYYGTISFNNNDFADDIGLLFHLGHFVCSDSNLAPCELASLYANAIGAGNGTPVVKFAGDVTATGNLFGGVAFNDLSPSGKIGLIARTIDISFDPALGFVDYGLLADQDTVYVDAAFAGSAYGQSLSFSHTQVAPGAIYFGINAFATITDGLTKVVDGGTVYIASGTYAGFTLSKHAVLVGNDSDRDGAADTHDNTLIEGQVTINASGVAANDPVALRNLEVSNSTNAAPAAGYGVVLAGNNQYIELTDLRVWGNVQHGLWVADAADIDGLVIRDSTFDGNGYTSYPGTESLNVGAGMATSQNAAAVANVLIEDCDFLDNAFGGIVMNNANVGGPSQLTDWEIAGGNVLRNNQATSNDGTSIDTPFGAGGGFWIKTSGSGSLVGDIHVHGVTFADNGSAREVAGRMLNRNGIAVRSRPDATLGAVRICGNTFAETASPGAQEVGVYIYDQVGSAGYTPVEICDDGGTANTFIGLDYSVSGYEQVVAGNGRPQVNITSGTPLIGWEDLYQPPASPVYVDDGYATTPNGTAVTFTHSLGGLTDVAATVGVDAFASISEAVTAAAPEATIYVAAGDYVDNVIVDRAVTVLGDGQSATKVMPALANPDCSAGGGSGVMCAGGTVPASVVFLVTAADVEIAHLTVDGINPALGAGVAARMGISTDPSGSAFNNFHVHDTTIRNIHRLGLLQERSTFTFSNNTIHDITGPGSDAIFSRAGSGVIENNVVSGTTYGITTNQSSGTKIRHNSVSAIVSSIQTDNINNHAETFEIHDNQVDCQGEPGAYGFLVFAPNVDVEVRHNQVAGCAVALAALSGRTTPGTLGVVRFIGNRVDGTDSDNPTNSLGVYATTNAFGFGHHDHSVELVGNDITGFAAGVYTGRTGGKSLYVEARHNRIVGNDIGWADDGPVAGSSDFVNNWWGCNEGPNDPDGLCDTSTGVGDVEPWLVLGMTATPEVIAANDPSAIVVDLTTNSDGVAVGGFFPDGTDIAISTSKGALVPGAPFLTADGQADTELTGHVSGYALITAELDNAVAETAVLVGTATGPGPVTVNDTAATESHTDPRATCHAPDFTSIQAAINAMPAGAEILVCPGTYAEALTISKSVTLRGAQAGVDGRTRNANNSDTDETVLVPPVTQPGLSMTSYFSSRLIGVGAADVTIDGLVLDADNPGLTSGVDLNGADIDYASGILAYGVSDRLQVRNNIIRNMQSGGIFGYAHVGDNVVEFNRFSNIAAPSVWGFGVVSSTHWYAQIRDNLFDSVRIGVQSNLLNLANPGTLEPAILRNEFRVQYRGVFLNQNGGSVATSHRVEGNIFSAVAAPGMVEPWQAVWIQGLTGTRQIQISDNYINGAGLANRTRIGYYLNNITTTAAPTTRVISGGTVGNVDVGVLATDAGYYTGPVNDFVVRGVEFANVGTALLVEDTEQRAGTSRLSIGAGNVFGSTPYAALAGSDASFGFVDGLTGLEHVLVKASGANLWGQPNEANVAYTVAPATINNGIAAAAQDGVVQVEAGTFTQTVLVNKRVRLLGAQVDVSAKGESGERAGGETIINPNASVRVSVPPTGAGAEVNGFTVTGTSSTSGGGAAAFNISGSDVTVSNNRVVSINTNGVYLSTSSTQGVRIEQNHFGGITGTANNGVKTEGSTNLVVVHNSFDGIVYQGIQLGGANNNALVRNNVINDTAQGGINIGGGTGIVIDRNVLDEADTLNTLDRAAIRIYPGVDAVVSCNTIDAGNNRGIYFHSSSGTHQARVFHNAIAASVSSLVNGNVNAALVGSNWYGGGAASTDGSGALYIADALDSSPLSSLDCGDNSPVVLVATSGTPQSASVNQPFGSDLVARLEDALGGAVVNANVTLASPASGASATLNPPSPALQVTDFNGQVEVAAAANNYAGSYNVVASSTGVADLPFVLTNLANYQVLFDIDGPVGGVQVGETVAYAGTLSNNDPALEEVYLRIRVSATDDASAPISLDASDVLLNAFHPISGSPLPLVWPAVQPFPGDLSAAFPADATSGAVTSLDIRPLPPATVFESLQNLAAVYARPGLYQAQIEVVGAVSGTVYSIDALHTEVIAEHAGVSLALQGPVAGVEKGAIADYNLLLSNTEAAVDDDVLIDLVFTRDGGIAAGDIHVYYYDPSSIAPLPDADGYVPLMLMDDGLGELSTSIGSYTLVDGSTTPIEFLENLRIVYNVAPHTFQIAATVVDATADTDGIALYAGDNIATDVVEADPDVELDLTGPFDAADGVTPVAARVGESVVLRGELRNEGGNVQAPVTANFLVGSSFTGIQAGDIVGTYGFLADIDDDCDTAVFSESLSFTEAGGALSTQTSPQPLPEGMAVAVCFQLEFQRAGVYSIGATIADAADPGQAYAADNLTFTVGKGAATVTLNGLGPYLFDGDEKQASATTTPADLTVDITYNGAAAPLPQAVGSYFVQATVVSDDWEGGASGFLIINPDSESGLVLQNLTVTYDGNPHGVAAEIVAANPNGASFTISYSGTTAGASSYGPTPVPPTHAGSYTATVSIDDSRYVADDLFASVDIDPASATVSFSSLSHVYDGTAKAATVATVPAGVAVSLDYLPTPVVNAAAYGVTATSADPNYVLTGTVDATLTIAKAVSPVEFSGPVSVVYTGTSQAVLSASLTLDPAATCTITYLPDAAPINVGSYVATANCEGQNHIGSAATTLTITKATGTVDFAPLSGPYGTAHAVTATLVEADSNASCTAVSGVPAQSAPAGSYPVSASCSSDNYTASGSATYEVTAVDVVFALGGDTVGVAGSDPETWSYFTATTANPNGVSLGEQLQVSLAVERSGGIAADDVVLEFEVWNQPDVWAPINLSLDGDVLTGTFGPYSLDPVSSTASLRARVKRGGHFTTTAWLEGASSGTVYATATHSVDVADLSLVGSGNTAGSLGEAVDTGYSLVNSGTAGLSDGTTPGFPAEPAPNDENVRGRFFIELENGSLTGASAPGCGDEGCTSPDVAVEFFNPLINDYQRIYNLRAELDGSDVPTGRLFGHFGALASGGQPVPAGYTGTFLFRTTFLQHTGNYKVTAQVVGIDSGTVYADTGEQTIGIGTGAAAILELVDGQDGEAVVGGNTYDAGDLVVRVLDIAGNPVQGAAVAFNVNAGSTGAGASFAATPGLTGADGETSVQALSNTVAGDFTVTASIGIGPGQSVSFDLVNVADDASQLLLVSGSGQTAALGDLFGMPLKVRVTDQFGNAVAGETVSFGAPASGASADLTTPADPTDDDGETFVLATANGLPGGYVVTASADGFAASVDFGLTNIADVADDLVLAVTGSDEAVVAIDSYALAATVTGNGNPVPGVSVTFVVEPGVNGAGTTLSNQVAITDAGGLATALFNANTVAGEFTVRAVVSGVVADANDQATLTNLADVATTLSLVSGNSQATAVDAAFGAALVVRASDIHGNPIIGAAVQFEATGTTANATLDPLDGAVVTGADGTAAVDAVANSVVGVYSVTATAGFGDPVSFTLENTTGSVTISDVVWADGGQTSVAYDGDPQAATATVSGSSATPVFTYNGHASAPVDAGTYLVTATVDDGNVFGSASAMLTIEPAAAGNTGIDLTGGSFVYDGVAKPATVTNPDGVGYTLAYNTANGLAPVNAGSYTATLTVTDPNHAADTLTATIEITPAPVELVFGSLSHVYDGTAKSAAVTTTPAGVTGVSLSYSPDAAPTNAGTYEVEATLSNPNYALTGTTTAQLVIEKATAQIFLSNLTQVYDGTQKAVTVTTVPAFLAADVVVGYTPAVPVNVGSYAVEAVLDDHPNYEAAPANGTLTIIAATIAGFEIVGDDSFSGVAGEALNGALPTVRVFDTSGQGVMGISIDFAVTAGNGSIDGAASIAVTTDADGQAAVPEWVLGAVAGVNSMTAATGLAGLPELEFTAIGEQVAQLSIDKSVNLAQAHAGQVLDYSIVVANDGPSTVQATLLDAMPDGLESISWICLAEDGAVCGETSGNGDIEFDSMIPAGGSITVTVSGTVAADATTGQPMVNTAVVTWQSEGQEQEAEDSASTNIVPAESGPCSIFCDGFEDVNLGKRLALPEAADKAAVRGWDLAGGLAGRPQLAVELVGGDGQAVAWLDSLKVGEQRLLRLRSLDAQGKQRAGAWQAWPEAAAVSYGWELGLDGLRLDFAPAGAVKSGALLQLQLPAGAAIPERARTHAATSH